LISPNGCVDRLVVFAIMLYPTISDRILRTRDGQCKYEQSENFYPSIVISMLGGHGPSLVIVGCYVVVYVEIRKLVRTRPTDSVRIGPLNAMPRHAVALAAAAAAAAVAATKSHDDCSADETGSRRSPKAIDVRVNEAKRNGLQHPKMLVRRLSAPSTLGFEVDASGPGTLVAEGRGSEKNALGGRRTSSELRRQAVSTAQQVSESNSSAVKRESKVFVTLSYIVIAYVICWVPYHFVFDLSIFKPEVVPDEAFTITFWMTYVNSVLNPFLYALSMADVRKSIGNVMKCKMLR
jgi:hypothetical protein